MIYIILCNITLVDKVISTRRSLNIFFTPKTLVKKITKKKHKNIDFYYLKYASIIYLLIA